MIYTNAEITERRAAEQPDARQVQEFRAYASGVHPDVLSDDQTKLLQGRAQHPMVDNILDLILKATASRLRLTKWDVIGDPPVSVSDGTNISDTDAEAVRAYLRSLWLLNRVQRLQYEVHYAALRDGNSAVSLAYRNGRVHLWREPWWDGDTGLYIAYTDDGEYEFAVKEWKQRERNGDVTRRRTIYEPGEITRWKENGDGWEPYTGGTESDLIRLMRTRDGAETPMPLPVIHFPNGTNITEGAYGVSDISSLLALQDDLNATQRDISAAALMSAFQRLFFAGVADPKSIKMAPGSAAGDASPDASVTVIQPGEATQLIEVHNHKRASMADNSRTPKHVISGEWPSGAALLQANMPLIDKVETFGDVEGPQWTMTAHRAIEWANTFGRLTLNEDAPITSTFAPAERIDELTSYEIKQAQATYWETIARMPLEAMIQAGVDPDAAQTIANQREAMNSLVADAGLF